MGRSPVHRCRDGAVVRALASHHYYDGPGLILGPGVTCGFSLLLVLVLAPRVFPGFSGFSLPQNPTLQFPIWSVNNGRSGSATTKLNVIYLFIYLFIYYVFIYVFMYLF